MWRIFFVRKLLKIEIFMKVTAIFSLSCFLSCKTNSTKPEQDALKSENLDAQKHTDKKDSPIVSPHSVLKWHSYFKTPPNEKERKELEQTLSQKKEDSVDDLLAIGLGEEALGNFARAETEFKQALRQDKDNQDAHLELAMLYLRMKKTNQAFELLSILKDKIVKTENPDSLFVFRYRYCLALTYLAQKEKDRGREILTDLIAIDSSFSPGYVALASSYLEDGKISAAEFIIKRGIDRCKEDPGLYNVLGVLEQKLGHLETAKSWYNKSLKISPTFSPAIVNRGNLALANGESEAALDDFKKALIVSPNNVEALISLAICYKKQSQLAQAQNTLEKAINLDPNSSLARFNMGLVLAAQQGNPGEALRFFYEVIQLEKKDTELARLANNFIKDLKDKHDYP